MGRFRFVFAVVLAVAILFATGTDNGIAAGAPRRGAAHASGEVIVFPTSGSPRARKLFIDGVRRLHNFEYDDAVATFRAAIKADPGFTMGYWGLAMSYNHSLWGEQDLDEARKAVVGLDRTSMTALSPREKGFVEAVRLLFGAGDKAHRDVAYAEAMGRLYARFPQDDEVASFYGQALLGTRSESHDFLITIRASDVLERVYARNPDHPGALHYLIHCYDDPRFATLGIAAADRYGRVAKGSAHALHMPSHIYLDEGMWDAYVQANEASWQASKDRIRRKRLGEGDYDIHGLHTLLWLEYGYLQQGRFAEATERLQTMAKIDSLHSTPMVRWYFAMMWATYAVDALSQPARLGVLERVDTPDLGGIELSARASKALAVGLIAARDGRTVDLQRTIQALDDLLRGEELPAHAGSHQHDTSFFSSPNPAAVPSTKIARSQLQALMALHDGKIEEAITALQDAVAAEAALPVGYGPPVPVKPSAELLGEVYLAADLPQSAMRSFQLALLRYPNRSASLAGLAQSARLAGDAKTAASATDKLARVDQAIGRSPQKVTPWPCAGCGR